MSTYQKTTWSTGDTITAEKLNNAENGIYSLSRMQFDATEHKIGKGAQFDLRTLNTAYNAIVIVSSKEAASTLLGLYRYDEYTGGGFTEIYKGENISVLNVSTEPNSHAGFSIKLSSSAAEFAYLSIILLHSN